MIVGMVLTLTDGNGQMITPNFLGVSEVTTDSLKIITAEACQDNYHGISQERETALVDK